MIISNSSKNFLNKKRVTEYTVHYLNEVFSNKSYFDITLIPTIWEIYKPPSSFNDGFGFYRSDMYNTLKSYHCADWSKFNKEIISFHILTHINNNYIGYDTDTRKFIIIDENETLENDIEENMNAPVETIENTPDESLSLWDKILRKFKK